MMTDNIRAFFRPKATDVEYFTDKKFRVSLIFRLDSYKFTHPFAFPDELDLEDGEQIVGMTSYGTARVPSNEVIIPAGMQILVKDKLTESITMEDVDAAEEFALAHFGRPLFARATWERVVKEFNGKLPLIIRAITEGTPTNGHAALYTVTAFGADMFWMSAGFETLIQLS